MQEFLESNKENIRASETQSFSSYINFFLTHARTHACTHARTHACVYTYQDITYMRSEKYC